MTKAVDEVHGDGRDAASGQAFDVDLYVPALLTNLANALTSQGSTFYRENFGVGLTDWRIMYRLAAAPGITAHQICLASMIDKGVVSRSIFWLEQQGIVVVENDTADARRRRLWLSQAGHELCARMSAVALARERNFVSVLSEAELATLTGLLRRLIGNLDAFSLPVPIPPGRAAPPQAPKRKAGKAVPEPHDP